MAFLKFSRDKRGVENFYLLEPTNRRGKVKPRLLYWFRSPPDVKVGREPFDAAMRQALESRNPDITFDWRAIVETPIPSADADKWRERRRVERAAKYAAAEEELAEAAISPPDSISAALTASDTGTPVAPECHEESAGEPAAATAVLPSEPTDRPAGRTDTNQKRRRRRRGGVQRSNGAPGSPAPTTVEPTGD